MTDKQDRGVVDQLINDLASMKSACESLGCQPYELPIRVLKLKSWYDCTLDKPEDRLYHAADGTWWASGKDHCGMRQLKRSGPPGCPAALASLADAARRQDKIARRLGESSADELSPAELIEMFKAAAKAEAFDEALRILEASTKIGGGS